VSLLHHIAPALLVIFRIGGLMIYGPVLGSNVVPVRVKVLLAFVLGAAIYPTLAAHDHTAVGLQLSLWMLAPLVALELLIGLVIGYLASLPLSSMQMGGVIISQQIGLGFAQLFNPAIDEESDVVGQLLFFMALATFVIIGGLDWVVLALLNTFERIPAGGIAIDQQLISLVTGALLSSLELGLRVAAPLLCIVFLETVALGFLSKTVPQLNILSLGFPLRILLGLLIMAVGLTVIDDVLLDEVSAMFDSLNTWIAGAGERA
jgi:flagellar biosynthetic protein FliR